jgi:arylsulfatase A-like enzyme
MSNVIWIVLDCVRKDFLGCYGNEKIYTPTIDGLAKRGVKFEEHITAAPWTNPSVTSMLTGISPHKLQMFRFREKFPPDVETFYHYIREEGYDVATYTVSEGWFGENDFVNEKGLTRNIDSVLQTIEEMGEDNFFLFAHYWNTHLPYFDKFSKDAWFDARDDVIDLIRNGDERSLNKAKNLYQGAIERASEEFVYAVLEKLYEEGIYDDTYVVVTGDHGESWGKRLDDRSNLTVFGMHGKHLYDEVLQVPLIISGPDLPANITVDSATRSIDVMPTLLDLLDIAQPNSIDGKSLLPMISGEEMSSRAIISSTSFVDNPTENTNVVSKLCYRSEEWKLVRNLKQDRYSNGAHELYHLLNDPDEKDDITSEYPEKVDELGQHLDKAEEYFEFSESEMGVIKDRLDELGYF